MKNFVAIGQTVAHGGFSIWQNGGRPPFSILEIRNFIDR